MAPFYGWGSTASKLEPVFDYAGRWVMIFFQFSPGRFLRTRLFFWLYLVNSLQSYPIVFCFWDYTFIFQLVLRFFFLFYFIIPQCLLNICLKYLPWVTIIFFCLFIVVYTYDIHTKNIPAAKLEFQYCYLNIIASH